MSSLAVGGEPVGLTPRGPELRVVVFAIEGWPSALPLGVAACPEVLRAQLEAADRARLLWQFEFRPAQRELEGLVVPLEA